MSLLASFFGRPSVECPRCLGKGHVDLVDIKRLKMELKWAPGECAYCSGTGQTTSRMVSNIRVDNSYLTVETPDYERKRLINLDEGALLRSKNYDVQLEELIEQISFLHFHGKMNAGSIADFYQISSQGIEEDEKNEFIEYVKKIIEIKRDDMD